MSDVTVKTCEKGIGYFVTNKNGLECFDTAEKHEEIMGRNTEVRIFKTGQAFKRRY